ncbi:MAG: DUF6516 family protein, partial [Anaerolineae bacterium]
GTVAQIKAVARLADGSNLHANEVWMAGELLKYAYYQVTASGDVVQGWDNAPHHPDVSTYPHHHHSATGVVASPVRRLVDVLDILASHG